MKKTTFATFTTLITFLSFLFASCATQETVLTEREERDLSTISNVVSLIEVNYVEPKDSCELINGAMSNLLGLVADNQSVEKEIRDNLSGNNCFKDLANVFSLLEKKLPSSKVEYLQHEAIRGIISLLDPHSYYFHPVFTKNDAQTKKVIPTLNVVTKRMELGYAYIRIKHFHQDTVYEFKKSLEYISSSGEIKGLIVDLRDNSGGLFDQPIKISDMFIDKGIIVSTRSRMKDQNVIFEAHSNNLLPNCTLLILANENTASGAEIMAAAIQDNKRGIIVGSSTLGNASIHTVIPLSNGGSIKIQTANFYTPNGRLIEKNGITPDIEIDTSKEEIIALSLNILKKSRSNNYTDLLEAAHEIVAKTN